MKLNPCIRSLFALAIQTALFAQPAQQVKSEALSNAVVLIIRHAEKSRAGQELSVAGYARAKAYVDYFSNYQVDGQPLKLDYIVAAMDAKTSHKGHPREAPYPRLTVEPLGHALGLAIDTRFNDREFRHLAEEIQTVPHGKAILVACHHEGIPPLLHALGAVPDQVLPAGSWPALVFDWVIQLRFDDQGRLLEAKRIGEKLMPGDAD
jgi:hypothetical protein